MNKLHVSAAPHIHQKGANTANVMLDVIIALIPAAIAAVVIFGIKALLMIIVCASSAVLSEAIFNLCIHKKQTIGDLSAIVTGLLLALNLSINVPLWQCALGSVFAIVIVKCLFGGIGKNLFNPAASARVLMLLTFSSVAGGAAPKIVELVSSATPLTALSSNEIPSMLELFLGLHGGAAGETSAIALLIGYAYLVIRKVIRWYVPAAFVGAVFVLYLAFACQGSFAANAEFALAECLAGGLLLGAIFMATDYATTPITDLGRVLFAVGCGILTFVIRQYCAYPEGVSIAILVMNIFTPFLERMTVKKTLGGVK